jgi:hypothetical protein
MAILAQETYSIRRLIDGKTLNFVLQSNQAMTQLFTPDPSTFVPNYSATPFLVITPSILIAGESGDQIAKLKAAPSWKINDSATLTTFGATASASAPYALTIKNNMANISQMKIECEGVYVQPSTLAEMTVKATMTFTKVTNNGASIIAVASAPLGTIFKNGLVSTLKAHCDMWRGSSIDNTNVTYAWSINQSGAWVVLTSANAATYGITGYTTNEIVIPASAVINYASFKCSIKDTDSGSSTYNKIVEDYISFVDMSDPYEIDVDFPNGDGVVSGGLATVKVQVRQGATRMADAFFTGKTIKHFRFNAAGTLDDTWGTAGYKTGRSLDITEADLLTGVQTAFGVQLEG